MGLLRERTGTAKVRWNIWGQYLLCTKIRQVVKRPFPIKYWLANQLFTCTFLWLHVYICDERPLRLEGELNCQSILHRVTKPIQYTQVRMRHQQTPFSAELNYLVCDVMMTRFISYDSFFYIFVIWSRRSRQTYKNCIRKLNHDFDWRVSVLGMGKCEMVSHGSQFAFIIYLPTF